MNRESVLANLKEAKEELDRTITELESTPDYEYGDFVIAMGHLYHHLNTAWNTQDESVEATRECSDDNFQKWRKFPPSEDLML